LISIFTCETKFAKLLYFLRLIQLAFSSVRLANITALFEVENRTEGSVRCPQHHFSREPGGFSLLCAITGFISISAMSLPVSMKDRWLVLCHCMSSLLKQYQHTMFLAWHLGLHTNLFCRDFFPVLIFKPAPERKIQQFEAVRMRSLGFIFNLLILFKLFCPLHPYIFHKKYCFERKRVTASNPLGMKSAAFITISNLLKP